MAGERVSGQCLCGAARFTAALKTHEVDACHCGMCRRWTGGVFLAAPASDIRVENEGALSVYLSSDHGERVFCATCGSSLMWRTRDGSDVAVSVQALDDQTGLVLAEEIFVEDKPAFYDFANDTRKLTGAEVFARWRADQERSGG